MDRSDVIGKEQRELAENVCAIVLAFDRQGVVTYWNRYAERFFGYPRPQIVGRGLLGTIVPCTESSGRDLSRLVEEIFSAPERFQSNENENTTRDGRRFWIRWNNLALRDPSGRLTGILSTGIDISDRKRVEEALRESEERYRFLVENAASVIHRTDMDGRVTYWNEYAEKLFGFSREEMLGRGLVGTIVPERDSDGRDMAGMMARIRHDPRAFQDNENENVTRDGRRLWMRWNDHPLFDREGRRTGMISVGVDMTARREAERALQARTDELNRAQAVARTGSWRLDVVRRELRWSDETYRIFGIPLGTPMTYELFLAAVHPDDRQFVERSWAAALRGEPYDIEHRIVAGGKVRWVREVAELELDERGGLSGGFGAVQDITERRKLEGQFLQAQKMESIGRLAGGVAHDFNNLLTVIAGNVELAAAEVGEGSEVGEALSEIRQAAERAAALTRKLLAFSRRQIAEPRLVDLNALLSEMQRMLHRLIGEHIELSTALCEGLPAVRIDPGQLEQVLTNLVVNCRDAMPDGGRLTLETAVVRL